MASYDIRSLRTKRYTGNKTSIVIGIDVGTTFSGVSYSILRPNVVPEVQQVTKFSDQSVGHSKIPSIIYYDLDDYAAPKAIGAATTKDMVISEAMEKEWFKAEHFKMHLRPPGRQLETNGLKVGELPPGKSAEEVMGDFLRYLIDETGRFISGSHIEDSDLWNKAKDDAIYVLGHPNGWSGYSQQRYRAAAILGGLVPDTDEGRKRIKFVTEGEASALACLQGGLGPNTLKRGFRFMIADAGGGTVDMTTFEVVGTTPLQVKEVTTPDCRFAGSVFVNMRAGDLLRRRLANSNYDDEDNIEGLISDEFEQTTKPQFTGEEDGLLKVGGRRDNNRKLGISGGYLRLQCEELASCFEDSIMDIVDSIREQFATSRSDERTTPVWLVGGFGSSSFLLKELRKAFEQSGTAIQTPDTNLSKAVANGAVLHYLDGMVVARVCPTSYGTDCYTRFDSSRSDHRNKPEFIENRSNGAFIGPIFDVIVRKGSTVDVGKTFTRSYSQRFFSKERATHYTTELLCYDGDLPVPYWYNENKEKFRTICRLEADLSALCREPSPTSSLLEAFITPLIGPYWNVSFDVELKFGTTEVEARIKWVENGVTKYGPVKIDWLK
ncbi:hypothetical protein ACEPAI_6878 [Sanghuangporus weigelae]